MEEKKYIRTVEGNIIENNEHGLGIFDILKEGDLVKIEFYSLRYEKRVTRLFEVENISDDKFYIHLSNAHCNFLICNGKFLHQDAESNPIITSIIPIEKLNTSECILSQGVSFPPKETKKR